MALIPCAGAIVVDEAGRLLLIQRGHDPGKGLWSVPGGRCQAGESAADACVREAREETGLEVLVVRHAGRVVRPGLGGDQYVIDDFVCAAVGGHLRAGDDADEAAWCSPEQVAGLDLTPGLLDALKDWGAWGA
jgi:8-oxo-dGTP diphosphatase